MSNNPTPPRIEREAKNLASYHYVSSVNNHDADLDDISTWPYGAQVAYYAGKRAMEAEHNRAAPVVKALEAIQREMILPAHLEELLHKTLLTYKADV